jgi:hypothetical protein
VRLAVGCAPTPRRQTPSPFRYGPRYTALHGRDETTGRPSAAAVAAQREAVVAAALRQVSFRGDAAGLAG